MGIISAYCGYPSNDLYRLWILIGMTSTIMDTHWNGLYYNGYLLEWPLLLLKHIGMVLLLLLRMGMTFATVDTQGIDLYYSCYSWEWPLLLLKHMGMVSTIMATHGNDLCYC